MKIEKLKQARHFFFALKLYKMTKEGKNVKSKHFAILSARRPWHIDRRLTITMKTFHLSPPPRVCIGSVSQEVKRMFGLIFDSLCLEAKHVIFQWTPAEMREALTREGAGHLARLLDDSK